MTILKLARGAHTKNKTMRIKNECMKPKSDNILPVSRVIALQNIQCSQITRRRRRERERERSRKTRIYVICSKFIYAMNQNMWDTKDKRKICSCRQQINNITAITIDNQQIMECKVSKQYKLLYGILYHHHKCYYLKGWSILIIECWALQSIKNTVFQLLHS